MADDIENPTDEQWKKPPLGYKRRRDIHFVMYFRDQPDVPVRIDRSRVQVTNGWIIFGDSVSPVFTSPPRLENQLMYPQDRVQMVEEVIVRYLTPNSPPSVPLSLPPPNLTSVRPSNLRLEDT